MKKKKKKRNILSSIVEIGHAIICEQYSMNRKKASDEEITNYIDEHISMSLDLDSLPNTSKPVIGDAKFQQRIIVQRPVLDTQMMIADALNEAGSINKDEPISTIVYVINKSKIKKLFGPKMSKNEGIELLYSNTLFGQAYEKALSTEWEQLADETKSGSNTSGVLFIKGVDANEFFKGTLINYNHIPFKINVLILAVPDIIDIKVPKNTNVSSVEEFYVERVTNDLAAAAIKLDATKLIFDPYKFPSSKLIDDYDIGVNMVKILNHEPCSKMIPSIYFAIENQTRLTLFKAAMNSDNK